MEWHIMNILLLQGYFSPVAVKYAFDHQDKVNDLILLNPPVRFSEVNNLFIFWSIWFTNVQLNFWESIVGFQILTEKLG